MKSLTLAIVALLSLGGVVAQDDTTYPSTASGDTASGDDPTTDPYFDGADNETDSPAADDVESGSDMSDPSTGFAPVDPGRPTFRDVHRCVHAVDDAFHKAHRYHQHLKQQMRAIEHRVTMLEIKEMRISNALDDIVVGEPINETQAEKLEKIIARAEAALEGDVGERKAAYLKHVIARAEAALESGVWTEDDVAELEKQLERIQNMQDRLLRKYIHLKHQLDGLRDRLKDHISDLPCTPNTKPVSYPGPDVRPDVKPDTRPDVKPGRSDFRPNDRSSLAKTDQAA